MADSISMKIAGVDFAIQCEESVTLRKPGATYQLFLGEVNTGPKLTNIDIHIELGNTPNTEKLIRIFDSGQSWCVFRGPEEYYVGLDSPMTEQLLWLARISHGFSRVTVHCSQEYGTRRNGRIVISNPVFHPLDQILLMYNLAQREGALLHAAGANIKGKGYMFPGKSGAGKSTITRQFALREHIGLLSDDRVAVRKTDGVFQVYGTPWPGDAGIAENTRAPLAGIFFIIHGSANRIKEITRQEALKRILPVTSIPWYDREVMPHVLQFCGDLITQVPTYELHFKPGVEVVDVLEDFISA